LLQYYLAALGSWYLILLGALAILLMLFAPSGVWGLFAQRFDVSLFPVRRRLTGGRAGLKESKTGEGTKTIPNLAGDQARLR
jgi:branched-chain amino acid transport system permease protein